MPIYTQIYLLLHNHYVVSYLTCTHVIPPFWIQEFIS